MQDLFLMLYWEFLPTLLQVIGAILSILLMRAANTAKTRWGIEIEARHREALHSALMSGIRAALSRGVSGEDAIREAIRHAGNSVPDAISALKPGAGVLASIAEAKHREAVDASFTVQSVERAPIRMNIEDVAAQLGRHLGAGTTR